MNRIAFSELHSKYRDRLLSSMIAVVRDRATAEDVTASAFQKAFMSLNGFRGESSLYTWLHAIALNEVRRMQRSQRTGRVVSMDAPDVPEVSEPDVLDQTLDRAECCRRVREVLRRIPTIYRRVLTDHFLRGRSTRQLARQYRIPEGTVLSRIFTGKRYLREAWFA